LRRNEQAGWARHRDRRIIARARELGACLQPRRMTAAERANADRFRTPAVTLAETATPEFPEG